MESTRVDQSGAKAGRLTVRDITRQAESQRGWPKDVRVMMARVGNDYRFVGYDTSVGVPGRYVTEGFVESEVGTRLVGRRLFADRVVRALQSGTPEMHLEVHVGPRTERFHAEIYRIVGRDDQPKWGQRYELNTRDMMRVALAWSEELTTTQRSQLARHAGGANEPTEADAQRVFRGSPAPGRGGGTPASTPAKGGASGGGSPTAPPTRQGASGGGPPTTKPSTTGVQGGQSGTKSSAASARNLAAELARAEREARRMVLTTRAVRYGLGAWQAVNVLRDVAKSMNMATAILAQGSPFAAQIQHADTILATARDIAQHYGSYNPFGQRIPEQDPSWNSFYDVYQAQLTFLLMEQSFHEALKEIRAASDNIEKQVDSLRDEMAAKVAATMFAPTSVVHAEVMLFADAGGKINARLYAAITYYTMAETSLRSHEGMTQALAQRYEMRLRELGSTGVFWKIPPHKIQSTPLDKFTLRR